MLLIATSFSVKKLREEHLKNILNKNTSFKVIRKVQVENEDLLVVCVISNKYFKSSI